MEPQSSPGWARWITYGSLVLALAALVWTIASVGPGVLLARLMMLGGWVFVVIGIDLFVTPCDAGAIHAYLRPEQAKVGFPRVLMAQVAGRAVNVVTPLGSLGEVVKITMLMERLPQSRAVSAILLYNLVDLEISLLLIAIGSPLTVLLVDLPRSLQAALLVAGGVAAVGAVGLPIVVWRGILVKVVNAARRLRLITARRHAVWSRKMADVDEKLRDVGGARRRDRLLGVACQVASRVLSWLQTGVLIHAAGGPLSVPFLAAVITVNQVILWIATVVPLGIGVSEGGNYALFSALGEHPAIGVTVALGRRVVPLIYAAIGLVLVSVSQTVKDVRRSHAARSSSSAVPAAASDLPGG
jgi:hypothetical protein